MGGRAKDAKPRAKPKRKAAPKRAAKGAPTSHVLEAKERPKRTAKATQATINSSLYSPLVDNVCRSLSWLGKTNLEMSEALGISEDTLYRWMRESDTLRSAVNEGREMALVPVVQSLYQRAVGYEHPEVVVKWNKDTGKFYEHPIVKHYPPDTAAIEFVLTNRLGGQWKKKTDSTLDINVTIRRALLELADGDDA